MFYLKRWVVFLVAFFLILILAVGAIAIFNGEILRSRSPVFMKTVVQLFFPPANLYTPLIDQKLLDNNETEFVFINNYTGAHEIGLFFSSSDTEQDVKNIVRNLKANITCLESGEISYSSASVEGVFFIGKDKYGYTLAGYNVPENLPIDVEINCRVYFEGLELERHNVRLYVKKISDL